jgi:hypothetical protein
MTTRNPVQTTVIACAAMALAALLLGLAFGQPRIGLALGIGLVVGSANGYLARRAISSGLGFRAASGARLAVLTVAGLGLGALLGLEVAWLTLLGIGLSQLVLAIVAAGGLIRR